MLPQVAADRLREKIHAPAGAVSVWPWYEDDGTVTMRVIIDPAYWVDISNIPKSFQGFTVMVERRYPPVVRTT